MYYSSTLTKTKRFFWVTKPSTLRVMLDCDRIVKVAESGQTSLANIYYDLGNEVELIETLNGFEEVIDHWCGKEKRDDR